jgi:hypothetical protein
VRSRGLVLSRTLVALTGCASAGRARCAPDEAATERHERSATATEPPAHLGGRFPPRTGRAPGRPLKSYRCPVRSRPPALAEQGRARGRGGRWPRPARRRTVGCRVELDVAEPSRAVTSHQRRTGPARKTLRRIALTHPPRAPAPHPFFRCTRDRRAHAQGDGPADFSDRGGWPTALTTDVAGGAGIGTGVRSLVRFPANPTYRSL